MSQNAILDWIKGYQKQEETFLSALQRLIKDKTAVKEFLDVIIQNPRNNKSAYREIVKSFHTKTQKRKWILRYQKAYSNYMNSLFKKASIEDLLKIIPNYSPWTLEQKFGIIKIGNIPNVFGNEQTFLSFVSQIYQSKVVKEFKRIKKLECYFPDFEKAFPAVKKIDWFNFSKRSVFLKELMKKRCGKTISIESKGHIFKTTFLCNPFSRKMVFLIVADTHEKFILKMAPYHFLDVRNDRVRKEHENMAISGDSTYSDSLLEFYLKLNNCVHAPDILYYHFSHEVTLYRAEIGEPLLKNKKSNNYFDFYEFNNKIVPDSARLGVYVNDINPGNFIVSDKDKQVKIIDIGHATFVNPLTPGIPGLTFSLGNLCGQDTILTQGVLEMEDV